LLPVAIVEVPDWTSLEDWSSLGFDLDEGGTWQEMDITHPSYLNTSGK
jgi:hypothetical protein